MDSGEYKCLLKERGLHCQCALKIKECFMWVCAVVGFFFLSTVEQVSHLISQMVFSLLKPHLLIILHWKGKGKSRLLTDIHAVSLGWTKINQSCTISCTTGHLSGVLTG